MMGILPLVSRYNSEIIEVAICFRGAPLSPPAPIKAISAAGVVSPSRLTGLFVTVQSRAVGGVYEEDKRRGGGEKPATDRRCPRVVKTRPIYKRTIRR